jgi:hypothetical protein
MPSDCHAVHLVIPESEPDRRAALTDLDAMLARIPETGFVEVWVMHGRFPALCALLNGDRGWLTCFRYEGDAGFSSRNPAYAGPPDAEIEFMLSNCQLNRRPAAWTYSREEILAAVRMFADTRRCPPALTWFNESGDTATSPDSVEDGQP